ncbi:MAG: oligosaccharide flippase family protein [Alkalimonas sp.]|nr:oligosaccharide flippase family protein [Alkalimonas sp.]
MSKSVSQSVLHSSAILLTIQLIQKSLGFVSTLVLARLLVPEHFGVVAMVMICLMFFENIADAGNQHYIIQKQDLDDEDLHTAWSMELVTKLGMFALILILAPFLARYFEMPQLTSALMVASLVLPLKALQNPAVMLFAKQLNYQPIFVLSIVQKIVSFIITITLAFLFPSHWPVIIGALASAIIFTFGSYIISQFRPRFSLMRFHQQWAFSKWLMLRGFIGFARYQVDNLLVSKRFSTAQLGGYHLLRELTLLPAIAVIVPCSQPLQAAIASQRDEAEQLAYRTRISLLLLFALLIPLTTFLLAYPALIVDTLLGNNWKEYNHLLAPFALFFLTFCVFDLVSNAFLAIGRSKLLFWFDVLSTVLIVGLLLLIHTATLLEMAWLRGWISVATTLVLLWLLQQATGYNIGRLVSLALPYVLFAVLALFISNFLILPSEMSRLGQLIGLSAVFFSLYTLQLLAYTWLLRKKVRELQHQHDVVIQLWRQRKED